MKLRQLQYVCEVARNGLSVTAAAERLYTSQPGISKQIRLLEEELGVQIFARSGKHLTDITPAGRDVVRYAERVLREVENITDAAAEHRNPDRGTLAVATTHTQARYALPGVVRDFRRKYPGVSLHIHQGTPRQIAEMASSGAADLAIATEALELFENLALLPCYRWNRCVLVRPGHPLLAEQPVTLEAIARHPIVTYVFGFTGRSQMNRAFEERGLTPDVVFAATDADVIKEYVRNGLGIGIVAAMAFDPERDTSLRAIDASHLFDASVTSIALRRNIVLRGYVLEFIRLFAPHLAREDVEAALEATDLHTRQRLFDSLLPRIGTRDTPVPSPEPEVVQA